MFASTCGTQPNCYKSVSQYKIVFAFRNLTELLLPQSAFKQTAACCHTCTPTCVTMECLQVARLDRLDSGSGRCCNSPGRARGRPEPDRGVERHSSPFPSEMSQTQKHSFKSWSMNKCNMTHGTSPTRRRRWTWSALTADVSKYSIPWLWAHSSAADAWTSLLVDKSDLFPTRTPETIQNKLINADTPT